MNMHEDGFLTGYLGFDPVRLDIEYLAGYDEGTQMRERGEEMITKDGPDGYWEDAMPDWDDVVAEFEAMSREEQDAEVAKGFRSFYFPLFGGVDSWDDETEHTDVMQERYDREVESR